MHLGALPASVENTREMKSQHQFGKRSDYGIGKILNLLSSSCDEMKKLTTASKESKNEVSAILNLGGHEPDAELSGRLYPA